jgi:hypothetical protein
MRRPPRATNQRWWRACSTRKSAADSAISDGGGEGFGAEEFAAVPEGGEGIGAAGAVEDGEAGEGFLLFDEDLLPLGFGDGGRDGFEVSGEGGDAGA